MAMIINLQIHKNFALVNGKPMKKPKPKQSNTITRITKPISAAELIPLNHLPQGWLDESY